MLPWFLLLIPLLSAATIVFVTRRMRDLSAWISVAAAVAGFVITLVLLTRSGEVAPPVWKWIDLPGAAGVQLGLLLDPLAKVMLLVVTGIGLLIHIFSLGYMASDEGKSRYFAGLSFFMFSMLGIVLADNFVMMFVFWELVGFSSYVLIGHWFDRPAAADAANKAFMVNRIGDFGFLLGILMLWASAGTAVFSGIEEKAAMGALGVLSTHPAYLGAAVLLIFCGTLGKSAQFPLHVWLPDAMEGPTPVSALIHAATMVAAGVYMLARVAFLLELDSLPTWAPETIAWLGGFTALLAALMATQQNDIKRILAYSTLSQLGYMVMAMGLLAIHEGMFHLYTHAFFKALLFLGAGAIIHACHHEQDIWKMGGLWQRMPITAVTFLLGTASLAGVPFIFAGAASKHAIFVAAFERNQGLFWIAIAVAFLTAFYMFRLVFRVFFSPPGGDAAKHAGEVDPVMWLPLVVLALFAVGAAWTTGFLEYFHTGEHHAGPFLVDLASWIALAGGIAAAYVLYYRKTRDPLNISLFTNRFYIDEAYHWLIRNVQGGVSGVCSFFDRWVLDTVVVRLTGAAVWGAGFSLRLLQMGNIQAYGILFVGGIVLLLYFVLMR